jgi:phosphoribosyl-AMP cyclohydrolase
MRLDCDQDVLLLMVTQEGHVPGIACHTGRHSCFFLKMNGALGQSEKKPMGLVPEWETADPVLKAPSSMYAKPKSSD